MITLNDLEKVNYDVNNSVTYETDSDQYKVPEYWNFAGKYGDCEDYALVKYQRLLSMGCPIEILRMAVCTVGSQGNQGHAVLLCDIGDQTYVLDNRYPYVMLYQDLIDYNWVSVQVPGSWNWTTVKK